MALTHNLGFPRIGARRELKQALEAYWRGDIDDEKLECHSGGIAEAALDFAARPWHRPDSGRRLRTLRPNAEYDSAARRDSRTI